MMTRIWTSSESAGIKVGIRTMQQETLKMFDGAVSVTVVVGNSGEWFMDETMSPPYEEFRIPEEEVAGCYVAIDAEDKSLRKYYPRLHHVVFNVKSAKEKGFDDSLILHECFHLFFHLLESFHQSPRPMEDIGADELYAREFTHLFETVRDSATRLLAEYKRKNKELWSKMTEGIRNIPNKEEMNEDLTSMTEKTEEKTG